RRAACFRRVHPAAPELHILSLHDALPILALWVAARGRRASVHPGLVVGLATIGDLEGALADRVGGGSVARLLDGGGAGDREGALDRKSTRLNSSHGSISYAVFCLKKKTKQ